MLTYIAAVLARSRLRPLVLAVGLLVAAVSFCLLTAAVQTGEAQVRGTVNKNFRAAYDILVRPEGSQTDIERSSGLVRPNFESGIYGGISERQWQQILHLPGVEVAAPVANAGIVIPITLTGFPVEIGAAEGTTSSSVYRVSQSWTSVRGTSQYPGNRDYVYATTASSDCAALEAQGDPATPPAAQTAFEEAGPANGKFLCYVRGRSPSGAEYWQLVPDYNSLSSCTIRDFVTVAFPLQITGIDPVQESKLLGLDHALVSGRMLSESDGFSTDQHGSSVPVIASTRTYADIALQVAIERVDTPTGKDLVTSLEQAGTAPDPKVGSGAYRLLQTLPGTAVQTIHVDADQLYQQALGWVNYISEYWTTNQVAYSREQDGMLVPHAVEQDPSAYIDGKGPDGYAYVNPASADVQYRTLTLHAAADQTSLVNSAQGVLNVVGRFDPARLRNFSPLSQVPLGTYSPPLAQAGNAATARVLGDAPYRPTLNMGGYLLQPPQLLTTIAGIHGLTSSKYFKNGTDPAPISVIRVRVAGVTGIDDLSVARIKAVAAAIHNTTGLEVDVTAGSSPSPQLVSLERSPFGTPALLLRENWVAKGVAVAIVAAIDHKSLALLGIILLVTALFLLNAGIASVRARRAELGTLLCMGWRPRQVAATVLGEFVAVGFVAAALGTCLAFLLSSILSLNQSWWRLAMVAPIAIGLSAVAGLIPAALAARGAPLDVVVPPIRALDRTFRRSSVTLLGVNNLRSSLGRTVLATLALYFGVAALCCLIVITVAFRGTVVGNLLGDVVSIQVRSTDYLIAALILLLAAAGLTDVLLLGMRERAVELVTLRAMGWSDRNLAHLVLTEGMGIGLVGAGFGVLTGALLGVALGVPAGSVLVAVGIAGAIGLAVAGLASLGPAVAVSRLPIGVASAEA